MIIQTDQYGKIKNILEKQLAAGRLSHAYLFMGPRGTGKKELARDLAGKVLGLTLLDENNHDLSAPAGHLPSPLLRPNFAYASSGKQGSGGQAGEKNNVNLFRHPDYAVLDCSGEADAENVRDFILRIALTPFIAQKKFALILNIENLNSQGANALLKTLEEPPKNTVIVLTADTRRVLPTVLSRCQTFSFNRTITPPHSSPSTDLPSESRTAPPYNKEGEKEDGGSGKIADLAGKALSTRLLAINRFADLEESELKQNIEEFIFTAAARLSSQPEKYGQLAAGLKAWDDLKTNKNKKLIMQGLMMKI